MVIINSPSNPSGAVIDREEFEKIFQLTSAARHLPDDRRVLLQVPVRQRAVLDRVAAGREGDGAGGRVAFEDLRDDGLAHRLRPRSRSGDVGRDQAAEPLHVEPDLDLAEGGGGSVARSAGIGGDYAGRVQAAPRLRGPAAAPDSRRDHCKAEGRVLRVPELSSVLWANGIPNTLQFAEQLLAEAHVAVVPGEAFGTEEHVRISYATSMEELERGLDRIHKFIERRCKWKAA